MIGFLFIYPQPLKQKLRESRKFAYLIHQWLSYTLSQLLVGTKQIGVEEQHQITVVKASSCSPKSLWRLPDVSFASDTKSTALLE